MIKKVLIFIITFIIFTEIYLLFLEPNTLNKNNTILTNDYNDNDNNNDNDNYNDKDIKTQIINPVINPIENKLYSFIDNNLQDKNNQEYKHLQEYKYLQQNVNKFNENQKKIQYDIMYIDNKDNEDEIIEHIDPLMYGKPSHFEKNNIIIWEFDNPKPWNKIIYKYNETFPFSFYIKIKIPSLNDYNNWKNINGKHKI